MSYLSLDISTTCTGFAVFDDSKTLIEYGYFDLSKETDLHKKMAIAKQKLTDLLEKHNISECYIEEYAKAYTASNALTIIKLAAFNEFITFIVKEKIGYVAVFKKPVTTIRKAAFGSGKISKDEAFDALMQNAKIFKPAINKKTNLPFNKEKDIADAIIVFVGFHKKDAKY